MVLAPQGHLSDADTGGFLAKEVVVVTESGGRRLSRLSHGPLEPEEGG